jgi:thymidylate kinase
MHPIVIEGHKGAGKTPLISAIKSNLSAIGISHLVIEPWQLAIKEFKVDPYFLFTDHSKSKIICEYLADILENSLHRDDKLIIFDRHWMTFLMSTSLIDRGRALITQDDFRNYFDRVMSCNPVTYFIAGTPSVLRGRAGRTGDLPWNEDVDYWNRLNIYNNYNSLFSNIHWVRKPRIDMNLLANKILSDYFRFRI